MPKRRVGSGHKLKDEHKVFLCQRLAFYDSPKEAAEALKDKFGIQITPQSAEHYDPNKKMGRTLAKPLVKVFEDTRYRFLNSVEEAIPLANKSVRLRKLAKAARHFEQRGAWMAMVRVIEAISKEVGGVNTNRREVTGRDGKPLELDMVVKSDAQLREEVAEHLSVLGPDIAAAIIGRMVDDGDPPTTKH